MAEKETWQDYRGKGEGVLVHIDTAKKQALPIRDAAVEGPFQTEPHYETGTFGLFGCADAKTRLSTMKNRRRYLLFGTRYQGSEADFKGRFLVIGYMRLDKVLEVRKRHLHRFMQNQAGQTPPECLDMDQCFAFQSEDMNFYAAADAFELSEELMRSWGYKGKITKQMKLTFTEDKLQIILDHLHGRTPRNADYIEAVRKCEEELERARAAEPAAEEW